jgi:hypothetical protein
MVSGGFKSDLKDQNTRRSSFCEYGPSDSGYLTLSRPTSAIKIPVGRTSANMGEYGMGVVQSLQLAVQRDRPEGVKRARER